MSADRVPSAEDFPANAAAPAWISSALIELTKKVWQPYYTSVLGDEDAVIILTNVGELFEALSRGSNDEKIRSTGAGEQS